MASLHDRLGGARAELAFKAPVTAASTGPLTLSGEQTVDGVALTSTGGWRGEPDRVLVKDQADAAENGIYTVSTAAWSRARDFDSIVDFLKGTRVYAAEGDTYANSAFIVTSDVPGGFVIDQDDIEFAQTDHPALAIAFLIDGGGQAIDTGVKGDLEVPFSCEVDRWTLLADQLGTIVIDIWKDTLANYPPTGADSITGTDTPTISADTNGQSSALTGWTTTIAAGDILRFNVDSVSGITRCTLSLKVRKV